MPQIDLVPMETTIFWLISFFAVYLFLFLSHFVYPILNSLKINSYLVVKRLEGLVNLKVSHETSNFVHLLTRYWQMISKINL
jgi:hypothetical protein